MTDIYTYLRNNTTPIYFVTPCPYNLLGIDHWIGNFQYISYYDTFDGFHPRVFTPKDTAPRDFNSMEEISNYLLANPETAAHFHAGGKAGKVLLVMFDEQAEALIKGLGFELAMPSAKMRTHIDSKITTTRLGNEAGVPSVPNALGRAANYTELMALAASAQLGQDLVVQTPYGDSGRTTFFIHGKDDWDKYAARIAEEQIVKVMKRLNHMPGTVEGCATRHGTLVGPIMTDITGFAEVTPYKGGWCGNDIDPTVLSPVVEDKVRAMVRRLGDRLWQEGYKGVFCLDFLLDTDTQDVWLGEINPRISGISAPTNLITATFGGCPLFLFHILEFMDVDWELDLETVQQRWQDYASWSQLVLKQTEDKVELITAAPPSGVWRMNDDGNVSFVRPSSEFSSVGDYNEALYLRVYGVGQYSYRGADLGILLTHGRMQTDDRQLTNRAKLWNAGMRAQFASLPPPPAPMPPQWQYGKLF